MTAEQLASPIGNMKLLEAQNKTAFLSSRHTPESCYDAIRAWLDSLSPEHDVVLVGNLQRLESYVFQGLIKRNIPAILVLSTPYPELWPTYVVDAIGEGRLLIISTSYFSLPWMDRYDVAFDRNKYMIEKSERVVVGMCRPGGFLSQQLAVAKHVTILNEYQHPGKAQTDEPTPQTEQPQSETQQDNDLNPTSDNVETTI